MLKLKCCFVPEPPQHAGEICVANLLLALHISETFNVNENTFSVSHADMVMDSLHTPRRRHTT